MSVTFIFLRLLQSSCFSSHSSKITPGGKQYWDMWICLDGGFPTNSSPSDYPHDVPIHVITLSSQATRCSNLFSLLRSPEKYSRTFQKRYDGLATIYIYIYILGIASNSNSLGNYTPIFGVYIPQFLVYIYPKILGIYTSIFGSFIPQYLGHLYPKFGNLYFNICGIHTVRTQGMEI